MAKLYHSSVQNVNSWFERVEFRLAKLGEIIF